MASPHAVSHVSSLARDVQSQTKNSNGQALAELIGRNWVTCRQRDVDRYKRVVAVCNVAGPEGPEINRWMVSLLIERYDADGAQMHAAMRADELLEAGDMDGRGVWIKHE